jgi:hypothetical protein
MAESTKPESDEGNGAQYDTQKDVSQTGADPDAKMKEEDLVGTATDDLYSDPAQAQLDPSKERKLLAKLDVAFVPVIMFAYLSCFLDRSNIGRCPDT